MPGMSRSSSSGVDLGLTLQLDLDFGERARHGDLGTGERLAEGRGERIAHHRMIVGDQEGKSVGHGKSWSSL